MKEPRIPLLATLELLICLFLSVALTAQTSRVNGNLFGTIVDTSGAVVPDATIQIQNTATGQTRTQRSDATGQFQTRELPSGSYRVTVAHEGFSTYNNANISISVGSVSYLTVQLSPASVAQQLTVTDQPTVIDPTQTAATTTIDPERIEELPVRSRNYLNFALLAPGVTASNQAASASSLALPESGFSFGGLRPRSNAVYIDGVDNNDEFTGASRTELSLETVREFQVVNQGLSAESGGAAGGSINVVTRTGANIHHGDAFFFIENGALDARPPLEGATGKPDLNRFRIGGALGGALKRDHTFYYSAAEQEHARGQAASDIDLGTIASLNPFLADGGVNGVHEITTGFFPITRAETELSGKIDQQIDAGNSLSIRYSFTNNREGNDAFNANELVDFSSRGSSFSKDHALVGGLTSLFGTEQVNDLRFQIATRKVALRTTNQSGPGVLIPGVIEFGQPYAGNNVHHENHYELSDASSWARGKHLIKAGISINRIHLRANVRDGFSGLYVFRGVDDLLSDKPAYFRQAFGSPDTNFPVNRYSGFVQDHWTFNSKLALDGGLRYDFEQLPSMFNQDINNMSPRIGLAFSPLPGWLIRSGFGIFFDRYPLAYLNNAVEKSGARAFDQVLDAGYTALPFPITTIPTPLTGVLPSIYRGQSGLANTYSEIATLGIEHALTKNLSTSVTYSFVRGVKLPRTLNVNLDPPAILSLQNASSIGVSSPEPQQISRTVFNKSRLNPSYDAIDQLENEASSSYHGLTLTVNRRLANEFELLASYTFSKAIDDASDFSESPQNPYDLKSERALSLNDQRQHLALSALFDLPFGEENEVRNGRASENPLTRVLSNIEIAPILTIGSGRPVDPLTGFDSNRTHTFPLSSRPLDHPRNSLRASPMAVLDLRVLKSYKIGEHGKFDIVAESFNLLNHQNIIQVGPWFGPQLVPVASFGRPIDALNPRQFQFSLDFEF